MSLTPVSALQRFRALASQDAADWPPISDVTLKLARAVLLMSPGAVLGFSPVFAVIPMLLITASLNPVYAIHG